MSDFDRLCLRAEELFVQGKDEEVERLANQLICADPLHPRPYHTLGLLYAKYEKDGAALACLQKCVDLNPEKSMAWVSLGNVLKRNTHLIAARQCYEQALKINPHDYYAIAGYSGSYVNRGNPQKGIELARRAIALAEKATDDPEQQDILTNARNNLALCLLEAGQWQEGWAEYENRTRTSIYHRRDYGAIPRWDGKRVKLLALHAEQGLGDEILFASCIADVLRDVDGIVLECAPRLLDLFRRSFSVPCYGSHEELMAAGHAIDAWDRLADLARRYRPTPDACPGTPYLVADPVKVAAMRQRLEGLAAGPYIGIAWKGGTKATHEELRRAPFEQWHRIVAETPGLKISLQYGKDGAQQAKKLSLPHWQDAIDDLDQFAALVAACDVVVSIPQTAVHFAGGLGVRCLALTPAWPSWQFTGGDRMCWYRTVELVRQPNQADWATVFSTAINRIKEISQ